LIFGNPPRSVAQGRRHIQVFLDFLPFGPFCVREIPQQIVLFIVVFAERRLVKIDE
jgi:hypothetical protein